MFLLKNVIEQLRLGTWSADCVQMSLTQNTNANPAKYAGQGYLRQTEEGAIQYKLYPNATSGVGFCPALGSNGTAGTLIEESELYRLETRTSDNICWRVERTIPRPHTSYLEGNVYHLVDGVADEMSFSRNTFTQLRGPFLTIVFFANIDLPFNSGTKTTSEVSGRQQVSVVRNVAKFSTPFGNFIITKQEGMVVVEVEADAPYPVHFESRIIEALGLVLAKPLWWNAIMRIENGIETVRVRGKSRVVDSTLPRPVNPSAEVWRLFEKYLSLISTQNSGDFHPCSRHVFSVLEASSGGISARGLALGVAVEGVVKEMFPRVAALPPELKPIVARLRNYFRDWPEFSDATIKGNLYQRVDTMLGMTLDVNAKSRLYALAKCQAVSEVHIKAWSDLRNTSAHGVSPGSDDLQRLLDLCNQVTVLLYHLIFKAAGYEGLYEDYATHEWPTRRYRGRPVTQEEIAVAAYFIYMESNGDRGNELKYWFAAKEKLERGLA